MPEDMPDRMPNRMSEDMSDRMPEDLPVRKCINVMVGITRSKVFFIFIFFRDVLGVVLVSKLHPQKHWFHRFQGSKNSGSRKFSAAATCLLFGRFTEEKMLQCTASACSLEDNTTNRWQQLTSQLISPLWLRLLWLEILDRKRWFTMVYLVNML